MSSSYSVENGLATLGPEALRLFQALEDRYLGWAAELGAWVMRYPALLPVEKLARVDYFKNFPHLASVASKIRPERLEEGYARAAERTTCVHAADLTDARYALPSAACFNVYFQLERQMLAAPRLVTTVATCFRNENHYDDLERLWSFTMREIVCVGSQEEVKAFLQAFRARLEAFFYALELPIRFEMASDPFFQAQGARALMAQLYPQKEEMVYGDSLAIGSLNFHRNFFGEKCDIRIADGSHAFTGCVAFGIERWIHALLDRFGPDVEALLARLAAPAPASTWVGAPAGAGVGAGAGAGRS